MDKHTCPRCGSNVSNSVLYKCFRCFAVYCKECQDSREGRNCPLCKMSARLVLEPDEK